MSNWLVRFLMFAGFALLQAMAPFIHAHAGATQFTHHGLLHLHEGVASDAAGHVVASDDLGGEIEVAKGVSSRLRPLQAELPDSAPAVPAPPVAVVAPVSSGERPPCVLPSPPVPPHFTPPALAPPAA